MIGFTQRNSYQLCNYHKLKVINKVQRPQVNNKLCSILHVRMLFFCCILFLSKSRQIFNRSPNSTQENLKPVQSRGNVYNPFNSHPKACMFIFSVSETLASGGACVQHKNTSFPWYSRVCTFGFLYLIAPKFNNKSFHYVHLPSRHQNPNNQTPEQHCSHSNYYPPQLLCLIFTCIHT